MDLSTLSPGKRRQGGRKRVGRGPSSGHGKTSTRGHKGQKARSGYSRKAGFEGGQMPINRRLPKRGFNHESRHQLAEVNLDIIEDNFEAGAEVTMEALAGKGLVKHGKVGIKVLGRGDITKKLNLKVNGISASAKTKVEGAGGAVELLPAPEARAVNNRTKGKAGGKR